LSTKAESYSDTASEYGRCHFDNIWVRLSEASQQQAYQYIDESGRQSDNSAVRYTDTHRGSDKERWISFHLVENDAVCCSGRLGWRLNTAAAANFN